MNKARDKGTAAETYLVRYLRDNGFPRADRRVLKGRLDEGDITGCDGLAWEVKWANGGLRLSEWVNQMAVGRNNARADHGVLVVKPLGVGARSVGGWLAVMMPTDQDRLIAKASVQARVTGIGTLRSATLRQELGRVSRESVALEPSWDGVTVVETVPPGKGDFEYIWYRVCYLRDLVRLLLSAGYGDQGHPPSGDPEDEAERLLIGHMMAQGPGA
jgi:hypothetical protein